MHFTLGKVLAVHDTHLELQQCASPQLELWEYIVSQPVKQETRSSDLGKVYSPRKIQSLLGEHDLGMACGHIKAFGIFPFHIKAKSLFEGLLGRHALRILGRTLGYHTQVHAHIMRMHGTD